MGSLAIYVGQEGGCAMKQSLFVVFMFVVGCVVGHLSGGQWEMGSLSLWILYALMFQVGVSVGCSDNLKAILRNFRPRMLLLPLATISGTLVMSALVSLVIARWGVMDCMAAGAGMGYYSLSSILVTQLKLPMLGQQLAAELGTIALLANIFRELLALVLAPVIRRWFGPYAPVTAAGVTSVDVCLPAIGRVSGQQMIPVALFHGMMLDLSVPLLVPLLCQ